MKRHALTLIGQHVLSTLSAIWVISNLLVWLSLLILTLPALLVLKPLGREGALESWIGWIYQSAVRIDSFWMLRVVGIQLEVKGEVPSHPSPIVIVNHQSWFDIPIVQEIISARGPRLTFLVKRSLVWVPVIGWICMLLGFPRLRRTGLLEDRALDLNAVSQAAKQGVAARHALLIFAEGTRFTPKKRSDQDSPFDHLLRPRVGGFAAACQNFPEGTPIIDLSIYYDGSSHFWRCLGGATKVIRVNVSTHSLDKIMSAYDFLNERWRAKDAWLQSQLYAGSDFFPAS
jgi:1-acyl-sn-glycerol-3-phosphate acyltransferase